MGELEDQRAMKEAVEQVAKRRTSGANRARLWASLNRYLAAEAEHVHKAARREPAKEPTNEPGRRAPHRER